MNPLAVNQMDLGHEITVTGVKTALTYYLTLIFNHPAGIYQSRLVISRKDALPLTSHTLKIISYQNFPSAQ
jgi:hypothetical protein